MRGMGQSPVIGEAAARHLAGAPGSESFLTTQVVKPVQMLHNGTIENMTIVCLGGQSGGTGSTALRIFAEAMAAHFLKETGAVVHIQLIRVGSASYMSLGHLPPINAAVTLEQDLAFVTTPEHSPGETRSLVLFELPMVAERKDLRDRFAGQFAQAFQSPGVRKHLDTVLPNAAFRSKYGCVSILQPSWYNELPERDVVAQVAAQYRPQCEAILQTRRSRISSIASKPDTRGIKSGPRTGSRRFSNSTSARGNRIKRASKTHASRSSAQMGCLW